MSKMVMDFKWARWWAVPMKAIGFFFSWPVTALASLHIGLCALGFDITQTSFVQNNLLSLSTQIQWIIGLAGWVSLISFVTVIIGCMARPMRSK